ncbi:recombinase family protein [Levilactobacillus tujiorum]|uniref:recombinase family protein n=1 Tax=Levilactobacillus tujiorum TaxID=2912243 RepID=UPI001456D5E7|nr:recombinase family protein [Levilactobacillus tujiorum]NLR32798.1 recombinase family protein [Levilactobacillus tujiorum]
MKMGYARVSTQSQSLDDQIEKLRNYGIEDKAIFAEKYTGTTVKRPEFEKLLTKIRVGDELVVVKLDRLARNTREALDVIDKLTDEGVKINVLNLGTFDDTASGRLMQTMLLAFAQFERDQIVERTQAGKDYAKKHNPNYHEGRPRIGVDARRKNAYDLLQTHTYKEVSAMTGYSVSTIRRIKLLVEKKEEQSKKEVDCGSKLLRS